MNRPALEVADIFRRHGPAYRMAQALHLDRCQRRVMAAVEVCRTAALGGYVERCVKCGQTQIAYKSCRDRHCPKCLSTAARKWLAARQLDLIPVEYFHVAFTLPPQIAAIAYQNKSVVYTILFEAAAQTLKTLAADPKHLGAEIGLTAVLHTWGQTFTHHPHIHCIVPGGGLAPDATRWVACRSGFFLPERVLSRLFRRLFLDELFAIHRAEQLRFYSELQHLNEPSAFATYLAPLRRANWVVDCKRPFARCGQSGGSPSLDRAVSSTHETSRQAAERLGDPPAELVMHGPFFAAPIGQATQNHSLPGLGMAREFDLNTFVDRVPTIRGERGGQLLQLRFRRADDVAPAGFTQPLQIASTAHAAVRDPDAPHHGMPRLHCRYDCLQCSRIVDVAREDLVAQRKPVEGHHQSDAHLLAVGAMIAGVTALRLRIGFRLAFKIGACDVVEQHFVLDCKQLAAPLRQMRFQRLFVREQMIKGAVEAVLVDLLIAKLKQVGKSRATVPILCNVQLARWLAEQGCHEHGRHLRPRNALLPHWQQLLAQILKTGSAPQRQRQVHVAKLTRTLDANSLQTNRHRRIGVAIPKKLRLFGSAD
jgi:hypothetical protein